MYLNLQNDVAKWSRFFLSLIAGSNFPLFQRRKDFCSNLQIQLQKKTHGMI